MKQILSHIHYGKLIQFITDAEINIFHAVCVCQIKAPVVQLLQMAARGPSCEYLPEGDHAGEGGWMQASFWRMGMEDVGGW